MKLNEDNEAVPLLNEAVPLLYEATPLLNEAVSLLNEAVPLVNEAVLTLKFLKPQIKNCKLNGILQCINVYN